jgi:hypothetical protein
LTNPDNCGILFNNVSPQMADRHISRGHVHVGGFAQTGTIYN